MGEAFFFLPGLIQRRGCAEGIRNEKKYLWLVALRFDIAAWQSPGRYPVGGRGKVACLASRKNKEREVKEAFFQNASRRANHHTSEQAITI
jgi:hypothetical protein